MRSLQVGARQKQLITSNKCICRAVERSHGMPKHNGANTSIRKRKMPHHRIPRMCDVSTALPGMTLFSNVSRRREMARRSSLSRLEMRTTSGIGSKPACNVGCSGVHELSDQNHGSCMQALYRPSLRPIRRVCDGSWMQGRMILSIRGEIMCCLDLSMQ